MKTVALCLVVVLGGFGFGWIRQQQILELRRKNAELKQTVAEIERCKQAAAVADQAHIDTNDLARLRQDWSELMRLRAEVSRLRPLAQLDLPQMEQESERLLEQVEREQQRGPQLLEDRATRLHSSLVTNYLNFALLHPMIRLAQEHGGKFPSSFSHAEQLINAAPKDSHWRFQGLWQTNELNPAEADLIGRSFSVSTDDFEFVPSDQPLTLNGPAAPLLRERQDRVRPDGRRARAYAFTDGRVEEVLSDPVSDTQ